MKRPTAAVAPRRRGRGHRRPSPVVIFGRVLLRRYAASPDGARLACLLDNERPPLRPWRWVDRNLNLVPAEQAHRPKERVTR